MAPKIFDIEGDRRSTISEEIERNYKRIGPETLSRRECLYYYIAEEGKALLITENHSLFKFDIHRIKIHGEEEIVTQIVKKLSLDNLVEGKK